MKSRPLAAVLAIVSSVSPLLFAQSTPSIDQGYAGATMVSGRVVSGGAPVVIYDASTSARTTLGTSQSVDKMGNFAVVITSPLVLGHSIVVVDHSGAVSAPMVVVASPASASHQ